MAKKVKEKKETTTIVLELCVYTQLKEMKIIPEEPFSNVIKRLLIENGQLKGGVGCGEEANQSIPDSEQKPKSV